MSITPSSETHISRRYSEEEGSAYRELVLKLRSGSVPDANILANLQLYQPRVAVGHMLFLNELYEQILGVPGSIAEFGVQWGRNLATLTSLRSLHEPNNMSRHVFGFDTFAGFPSVTERDGTDPETKQGGLAVSAGWEHELNAILRAHQRLSFRGQQERFELIKGDASETVRRFFEEHPHTLFALVYLDLDLYEPTKIVLETVWPRVPKGGIIAFDEINLDLFPGETGALLEVVGLESHRLVRSPYAVYQAYLIK